MPYFEGVPDAPHFHFIKPVKSLVSTLSEELSKNGTDAIQVQKAQLALLLRR